MTVVRVTVHSEGGTKIEYDIDSASADDLISSMEEPMKGCAVFHNDNDGSRTAVPKHKITAIVIQEKR